MGLKIKFDWINVNLQTASMFILRRSDFYSNFEGHGILCKTENELASLGMKTGFSSLKCAPLHFSLYICRVLVSRETTMQECVRKVHHTLLYIQCDFISFSNILESNVSSVKFTFACLMFRLIGQTPWK